MTQTTPTHVRFDTSREDWDAIRAIVERAQRIAGLDPDDRLGLEMDLSAAQANTDRPFDLQRLLGFPDTDFLHDVAGIRRHLDRTTGQLTASFAPRCGRRA